MSAVELFTADAEWFRTGDTFTPGHIRVIRDENGDPLFIAADIARALGYRMASDMTRRIDPEDRGTRSVRTPSGEQDMTVLTESGFYTAVLGSQVAHAKDFKRWVTGTVLPEIRKTGGYNAALDLSDPIAAIEAANQRSQQAVEIAKSERAARVEAERHAKALEAPAAAWSHMADSSGDYDVSDAAKVLSRDPSIRKIGRDRLFSFMAAEGWIFRNRATNRWKAYQTQVDLGRLTEKLGTPFLHEPTGQMRVPDPTIRITPKGLAELHKRLGGSGQIAMVASA